MDKVLADTLVANLKSAKTPDDLAHAQTLALIAIVDCQCKTAERVKALVADQERRSTQVDVVAWIFRAVASFFAAGGLGIVALIARKVGAL